MADHYNNFFRSCALCFPHVVKIVVSSGFPVTKLTLSKSRNTVLDRRTHRGPGVAKPVLSLALIKNDGLANVFVKSVLETYIHEFNESFFNLKQAFLHFGCYFRMI